MADIGLLTLNIISNTKPIEDAGRVAKETADEIKRTNVELSTFLASALQLTQRNIESTLNSIESIKNRIEGTKIDIQDTKNEIELLHTQIKSLESLQSAKNIQEAVDAISLVAPKGRGGGIPGSLLSDLAELLDPNTYKDLFLQFRDVARAGDLIKEQRIELDFLARNISVENDGSIRESTLEERILRLNKAVELQKQIDALAVEMNERGDNLLVRSEPLLAEKFKLQEAIEENKKFIEEKENLINKDEILLQKEQNLLQKLKEDEKNIIKQIQESGIEIPEDALKLDLEIAPGSQKEIQEQIDNTKGKIDEQRSSVDLLNGAVAMLGDGYVAGAGAQSEFLIATENTAEQLESEAESINNAGSSLGTLISQSGTFVGIQEQVNQTVGEGGILFEDAGTAAEGFGETVSNIDTSGGFFDGFKQGFVDFVEAVGDSGELIANFFANTLSQISQNFSDLLFNVIKGNFDDLGDLAEQAFDSILKSFLDLVSAIATKQIVVSIGGLFGIGGDAGGGDNGLIWENEAVFHENETGIGVFERENGKNEVNLVVFDKNESEWRLAA